MNHIKAKWEGVTKIVNIIILYHEQEVLSNLFNEDFTIASETKYRAINGEWMQILTPKQIVEKFAFALAQAKADNTNN